MREREFPSAVRHLSAFVALKCAQAPLQLFNSITGHTIVQKHELWYGTIRRIVSDRICTEEERMPSYTSLWRHWLRSCWIANMWRNSPNRDVYGALPPPEEYWWKKDSTGQYKVDWESSEIQLTVEQTINFLTKGCSCKKGCKTKQCSCRKNGRQCGPGCQCQGCTNLVNSNSSAPSISVHPRKSSQVETKPNVIVQKKVTHAVPMVKDIIQKSQTMTTCVYTCVCTHIEVYVHVLTCIKNGTLPSPPYICLQFFYRLNRYHTELLSSSK